jgi:hypothetical protein
LNRNAVAEHEVIMIQGGKKKQTKNKQTTVKEINKEFKKSNEEPDNQTKK